jgi:hypothetical protein
MSIIKLNNQGVKNATAFGSINVLGSMVFIKKLTASSSANLSFVDGSSSVVLDNTYKEYLFTFNNIHPSNDSVYFQFNMSTDGGSNYNVAKTSTAIYAYHRENDADNRLLYGDTYDLAQSTGFQYLSDDLGSDNDQSCSGTLQIFNPSSDTYVKHFISNTNTAQVIDYSINNLNAGYGNTTSPVNAIKFQMTSGNIDAGDICLYGIA